MGIDFRSFGDKNGIEISDAPADLTDAPDNVFEQLKGVSAEVRCIRIGKQEPDITQMCCPQKRVNDGVCENIRIAVTVKPFFIGNFNAPENEFSTVCKAV